MSELTKLTLAAAKEKITKKEISSVELTTAYLEAIDARNPELNAFISVTHHVAMEQARHSDERIKKGEARTLEGLPIAVKDLFCTKDIQTTAASNMLRGFVPAYESTVTQNLLDAGTVTLGKTNLDEFAMGSANITSAFGNVKNPWKGKDGKELVPGGSSGGSAAAVSGDLCLAALGTDTGGSIRQPAAFTGIVGFKPTYGRCSRWGIIAFASSLDQAGPMTKTVEDAGLMFSVMAGHDAKDSTSSSKAVPDVLPMIKAGVKGKRIGIPKEYRPDGLDAEIVAMWDKAAQLLKEAGAEIVDISLPHTEYALATYYVLAPAECSSNLARYDGVRYGNRVIEKGDSIEKMYEKTRAAGFGAEVKRRIMIGTYVLSAGYYDAYYKKAQRVRSLIIDDFRKAFEKVDVILTPTAPTPAFGFGENMDDPVTMYLNDVFTIPASLAGLPGLALPGGLNSNGLPIGLQLLANNFDESGLFAVAGTLEQVIGFSAKAA